jgi:hypothetical protein
VASTSGSAHKTNDIATSAVFVDGSTTVLQVVISVAQMTTLKGTDSCTLLENQGFTPVPFHRNETAPKQQIQQLKTKSANLNGAMSRASFCRKES